MKTVSAMMKVRVKFQVDDDATDDEILDLLNELDYTVTSDDVEITDSDMFDYTYRLVKD